MSRQSIAGVGEEIREAREALDLSREGLAHFAGVNLRTIERIEAGDSQPRRATLAVIRQALAQVEAEEVVA